MTINKITDDHVTIIKNNHGDLVITLKLSNDLIEKLDINAHGVVNTQQFIQHWLAETNQANSDALKKTMGKYTFKQWIFDSNVAHTPKKNNETSQDSTDDCQTSNPDLKESPHRKERPLKLDSFKQEIISCIAKGVSYAEIAKLCKCHINTVKNYIIKRSLLPNNQGNLGSASP